MQQLQVTSFLEPSDDEVFSELFDKINELVVMMREFSRFKTIDSAESNHVE